MHTPPLILIADDESDVAEVLEHICSRQGYGVSKATDGYMALEHIRAQLPDLVLLDIQMPQLDGWAVLREISQEDDTKHIPVIVITATATAPEDAVHGIALGANDYIVKPFSYDELIARIQAKLRAKHLEETLRERTKELELLVNLGIELNRPTKSEQLAGQLLQFLTNNLNVFMSMIFLTRDNSEDPLILRQTQGKKVDERAKLSQKLLQTLPEDLTTPYRLDTEDTQSLFGSADVSYGIVVPLRHHEMELGFLAAAHTEPFNENTLRVLNSVGQHAALALSNAQLYEQLRDDAQILEKRVELRTTELRTAQAQLVLSEKLASLGRLAGEIAHEINNPLQPIMTCLDDAIEDIENNQPVHAEDLRVAMQEVQRLKNIVTSLLDLARPQKDEVTRVILHDLITGALTLTRHQLARTKITLVDDIKKTSPVTGNPDQLKQVFLNLTLNAIQAMASDEGTLEVRVWPSARFAHFSVRDTGPGIPEDTLSTIFEPFYSSKINGSGIGLTVSHSIIDAHRGTITVQSQDGAGTEFTVSLPVS